MRIQVEEGAVLACVLHLFLAVVFSEYNGKVKNSKEFSEYQGDAAEAEEEVELDCGPPSIDFEWVGE